LSPNIDPYTIPYYGNSNFLQEVMNLFPTPNEANLKSAILESYNPYGASFDIPIKVWIYRDPHDLPGVFLHQSTVSAL